ncbi:hypothetical protein RBB50_011704 [Rhinocladiella similis]
MANGMKEADDPKHCPYTARHGQDGTISWAILAQLPKRLRAFQLGCAYQDGGFPVVGFYDFGPLAAPVDSQKATRLWTLLEAKGRLLPTFSRFFQTSRLEV